MDWKDVAAKVTQVGLPTLGGLLTGGPVGAAAGAIKGIASALGVEETPDAISHAIDVDPTAAVKLAEIQTDLQKAGILAGSQDIASVNKSIQVEATAEHWPTWFWRPFIGMQFGLYIFAQWFLPLVGKDAPTIDNNLMLAIGAILGAASWWRGKMQTIRPSV